jgi:hypothetical protein
MEDYKSLQQNLGCMPTQNEVSQVPKRAPDVKNTSTDEGNKPEMVYKYDVQEC